MYAPLTLHACVHACTHARLPSVCLRGACGSYVEAFGLYIRTLFGSSRDYCGDVAALDIMYGRPFCVFDDKTVMHIAMWFEACTRQAGMHARVLYIALHLAGRGRHACMHVCVRLFRPVGVLAQVHACTHARTHASLRRSALGDHRPRGRPSAVKACPQSGAILGCPGVPRRDDRIARVRVSPRRARIHAGTTLGLIRLRWRTP